MRLSLATLVAAAAALGCQQIDYVDIQPSSVALERKSQVVWLQAHPMSHTGVYYSRVHVSWSVKDPSIAQVDEVGKVTPVKSGQTEVVAKAGSVTAAVPVEVLFSEKMTVAPSPLTLEVGQPAVEMHVKVFDYLGRELKDRTATFHSGNDEVLSMGQNAAFAVNPGKTTMDVMVDGLKQQVDVTVVPEKAAHK